MPLLSESVAVLRKKHAGALNEFLHQHLSLPPSCPSCVYPGPHVLPSGHSHAGVNSAFGSRTAFTLHFTTVYQSKPRSYISIALTNEDSH